MNASSRHLVFHGSLVLLWGLLLGAPYGRAIQRQAAAHIVNAWRVAHLSLPIGAVLMLAVAAIQPWLALPSALAWAMSITWIVSGYAFCISTPLAAITGQRGLSAQSTGWGRLVYAANMVGAASAVLATLMLLYASWMAL